jgi:hypothetical protein
MLSNISEDAMKGTHLECMMQGYGDVMLNLTPSCKPDMAAALPRYHIANTVQTTDEVLSAYVAR